jgi:hypothetical protein
MVTMTDLGNVLIADSPLSVSKERPEVRIDLETMAVAVVGKGGKRFGKLLHYREAPSKTPTGGKFVSRRVKVRRNDGTVWVGQYRTGADTVILRPEK